MLREAGEVGVKEQRGHMREVVREGFVGLKKASAGWRGGIMGGKSDSKAVW